MIAFPVNRHRLWQLAADALLVVAAWQLAFFLRFDHPLPSTTGSCSRGESSFPWC